MQLMKMLNGFIESDPNVKRIGFEYEIYQITSIGEGVLLIEWIDGMEPLMNIINVVKD